jgi:RNA 3'-terminal phosphate cyclase (ATP)
MESSKLVEIDGSFGEGGGQILRTSLALSLFTGRSFRIKKIRAGRKKPGLLRQHLTAVRAASEISQAKVDGASIGSVALSFVPVEILPGKYHFTVCAAGSATLVLQTVLPALLLASGPSWLTLEGGTHNPYAPPFDFLQKVFLPIINLMGPTAEARLLRHGFYPMGGGRFEVTIQPVKELSRINLLERGKIQGYRIHGIVSKIPLKVAEREVKAVIKKLSLPESCTSVEEVDSPGPGNTVAIEIESEHVTEVFTGFGKKGVPAEKIAMYAVNEVRRYLSAGVPVGTYLADQLLVPMTLAGGGTFLTLAPSHHTNTNIQIMKRFLDVEISKEQIGQDICRIEISKKG